MSNCFPWYRLFSLDKKKPRHVPGFCAFSMVSFSLSQTRKTPGSSTDATAAAANFLSHGDAEIIHRLNSSNRVVNGVPLNQGELNRHDKKQEAGNLSRKKLNVLKLALFVPTIEITVRNRHNRIVLGTMKIMKGMKLKK